MPRLRPAYPAQALALALAASGACAEPADDTVSIEGLLKAGWQIAGYTSSVDNRSAFILFKHPSELYLVQCRTGYDVTRETRVYANCYKLR